MGANPKVAEQFLKPIRLADVLLSTHHAQQEALAEATRAYEEQAIRLLFQLRDIHCLVNIILISLYYIDKVRNTVRYTFHILHVYFIFCFAAKLSKNIVTSKLFASFLLLCQLCLRNGQSDLFLHFLGGFALRKLQPILLFVHKDLHLYLQST